MLDNILGTIQGFIWQVQLAWGLFFDERVPVHVKIVPILSLLYLFSPLDLIPDIFLIVGQVDDVVIMMAGLELFERLAPQEVVAEHKQRLGIQDAGLEIEDDAMEESPI